MSITNEKLHRLIDASGTANLQSRRDLVDSWTQEELVDALRVIQRLLSFIRSSIVTSVMKK